MWIYYEIMHGGGHQSLTKGYVQCPEKKYITDCIGDDVSGKHITDPLVRWKIVRAIPQEVKNDMEESLRYRIESAQEKLAAVTKLPTVVKEPKHFSLFWKGRKWIPKEKANEWEP